APTCGGEPTPPWPGPASTDGCGCSPTSTTGRPKPGPTSPRQVTGSPRCSRSTTPSSTASEGSDQTWPGASASATTGDPNTGPATSWGRLPGSGSQTTPPTSENPKPKAAPSGSSAPSKSNASGPNCMTLSTTSARQWRP